MISDFLNINIIGLVIIQFPIVLYFSVNEFTEYLINEKIKVLPDYMQTIRNK